MRGPQGKKAFWIDVAACMLLLSILAAHVIRDPSPWTESFYESARFDGQLGVAGLFAQAAAGEHVDHLLWPGLPILAMGRAVASIVKFDRAKILEQSPREAERTFYGQLDTISRVSNGLGFLGVFVLVVTSYFLVVFLFNSRAGGFALAAYLAASQTAVTQIGWIRSEVWSLSFLALALLTIAPSLRNWLVGAARNHDQSRSESWIRPLLFGFFLGSACLSKMNVLPAAVVLGLAWVALEMGGAQPGSQASRASYGWFLLPLLLLPWCAMSYPSPDFFRGVSEYDAAQAARLSQTEWQWWMAAMVALALPPVFVGLLSALLSRVKQHQLADKLRQVAPAGAVVLSGGLAALLIWTALISAGWAGFRVHLQHLLVTLPAAFESPYLEKRPEPPEVLTYLWNAGAELGRPHGGDFLNPGMESLLFLERVNPTSLALLTVLGIGLGAALIPWARGDRRMRRHAILATGFGCLLLLSEYIAAARAQFVDFRYYAYALWFGLFAIAAGMTGIIRLVLGKQARRVAGALVMALGLLFTAHAYGWGVPTASQRALYGRQIDVGARTAPSLFDALRISPDTDDWKYQQSLIRFDLAPAFEAEAENSADFRGRFQWEKKQDGSLRVVSLTDGAPHRLWLRLPLPEEVRNKLIEQTDRDLCLSVRFTRELGELGSQPVMGFRLFDAQAEPKVVSHWAAISSSWHASDENVEFASEIDVDLRRQAPSVVLSWQPAFVGDAFTIRDLMLGWTAHKSDGED